MREVVCELTSEAFVRFQKLGILWERCVAAWTVFFFEGRWKLIIVSAGLVLGDTGKQAGKIGWTEMSLWRGLIKEKDVFCLRGRMLNLMQMSITYTSELVTPNISEARGSCLAIYSTQNKATENFSSGEVE